MAPYIDNSYATSLKGPRKSSSQYGSASSGEMGIQSTQTFATDPTWKQQPDRDPYKKYKRGKAIVQGRKVHTTREVEDDILPDGLRWKSKRDSSMSKEEQHKQMELHYPALSPRTPANRISKSMTLPSRAGLNPFEMSSAEYDRKQKAIERALATRDDPRPPQGEWSPAYRQMLRR